MHKDHKVLEIYDEEQLKKEKLEDESFIKEFNNNLDQIVSLKEKIEKEIDTINKLYVKLAEN